MKQVSVLKFGGSSVGTIEKIKDIFKLPKKKGGESGEANSCSFCHGKDYRWLIKTSWEDNGQSGCQGVRYPAGNRGAKYYFPDGH